MLVPPEPVNSTYYVVQPRVKIEANEHDVLGAKYEQG